MAHRPRVHDAKLDPRLDSWPENGIVEIPLPPLATVSAVTLYARDDTATLLDPARFVVDLAGGRIALRQSTILPPLLRVIDAIQVAFTAGYGDATAVPQPLKTAILETVVFLYEHRGDAPADLPQGVQALLAPYRVFKL